ncbi:hypothetical protein [Pseudomonas cremoricolorata]|uniref:hypothetical protein n=1 Tax=Pseudomonas cremoricolorata TaxID=157783 RepID=UPI000416017F|nr:hypothetical protein [Pseudomonas cremoricolorata]
MSAEQPMTADLFEVDKRLSLKPVTDFNSYLRSAFGDGPCSCYRCAESGGDQTDYSHLHTFEFDAKPAHRRFASTAASDVLQKLKKAWLSYTQAELQTLGVIDLDTLKTFTDSALHPRLFALLGASGLAREEDGQWHLQALAD